MKRRAVDVTVRVIFPADAVTDADIDTVVEMLPGGFAPALVDAKHQLVPHARVVAVDRDAEVTEDDVLFDQGLS